MWGSTSSLYEKQQIKWIEPLCVKVWIKYDFPNDEGEFWVSKEYQMSLQYGSCLPIQQRFFKKRKKKRKDEQYGHKYIPLDLLTF